MGKILLLDELTSSKIAAGEVVERPASVVREMVDNAVDAGATRINIEIKNGGIKYIRIEDNGIGFEPDDVVIAFDKHATSKIVTADDIENVKTLGFRGEALASIAAVSKVSLKTKTEDAETGVYVVFQGGELIESGACGCKKGSTFLVENLFYNTPARFKFLKKDQTEGAYVCDVVEKAALAHPEVSFTLVSDKKPVLHTPGNGDMLSAVYGIFGKDFTQFLKPVSFTSGGISVNGFAGKRELTYGNRSRQLTFVNGRFIKNKSIQTAIDESYKTLVMRGKFPCVFLDIRVNPSMVDVNVSPAKTEVRFSDENLVFKAVYNGIYSSIFDMNAEFSNINTSNIKPLEPNTAAKPKTSENFAEYKVQKDDIPSSQYITPEEKAVEVHELETIALPFTEERQIKSAETYKSENKNEEKSTVKEAAKLKIDEEISSEPLLSPEFIEMSSAQAGGSNVFKDVYLNARVIGQLFETYILLEYENSFYMLDQHAAHERLMFERISRALVEKNNDSQMLLVPVTVTLTPSEMQKFRASKDGLTDLGFELDEFGINTVIIRSVPMLLDGAVDPENFVVGAIREFDEKSSGGFNVFTDNEVYTMACKAAIKANHRLSDDEIRALLKELSGIPDLDTCPHGRPIIIKMTKYEIERKFHRA